MQYVLWILLGFLPLCIIRVVMGPSTWDRLLGLNLISAKLSIVLMFLASLHSTAYLLDVAISFVLLGFISTIFIAVFMLERKKGGTK